MKKNLIVSLCDVTGIMVEPWVRRGYRALLVDPQHPLGLSYRADGVMLLGHVVDDPVTWALLRTLVPEICFVAGFPVCTDLAVSGSVRFEEKRQRDPHFQARAMQLVHECRVIGQMCGVPWFFENPVSVLSSIYRKPDYTFNPNEYGGYLPEGDAHPHYPEYFPSRDAYGKKTCIWAGGGFVMPLKRPVPIAVTQLTGQGQSAAHNKLGGKSERTKNIRSATPRGFAEAVFLEYDTL